MPPDDIVLTRAELERLFAALDMTIDAWRRESNSLVHDWVILDDAAKRMASIEDRIFGLGSAYEEAKHLIDRKLTAASAPSRVRGRKNNGPLGLGRARRRF